MNVSNKIMKWLNEKNITHLYGIIGAGNIGLWDAAANNASLEKVFTHHEQAAAQASTFHNRVTQRLSSAVLVTTGAGSTNAITGVMAAFMDSQPLLVLSGNEPLHFIRNPKPRVIGVQGFDSVEVAINFTNFAYRCDSLPLEVLEVAYKKATTPRYGPVWVDIPRDVQMVRV